MGSVVSVSASRERSGMFTVFGFRHYYLGADSSSATRSESELSSAYRCMESANGCRIFMSILSGSGQTPRFGVAGGGDSGRTAGCGGRDRADPAGAQRREPNATSARDEVFHGGSMAEAPPFRTLPEIRAPTVSL